MPRLLCRLHKLKDGDVLKYYQIKILKKEKKAFKLMIWGRILPSKFKSDF